MTLHNVLCSTRQTCLINILDWVIQLMHWTIFQYTQTIRMRREILNIYDKIPTEVMLKIFNCLTHLSLFIFSDRSSIQTDLLKKTLPKKIHSLFYRSQQDRGKCIVLYKWCAHGAEQPLSHKENVSPRQSFASQYACGSITKTRLFKQTKNSTTKNRYFSYICSKHRLWILVRTVPTIYVFAVLTSTHNLCFWAEIRRTMYTHVNPSFTI